MIPLNTIIGEVVDLPPTPRILPKLQKLLKDENSSIHDIISLLKVDAPMTAKIVRLSNSAYYSGGGDPVQSLEEAVNRIGFREVYRVTSIAAASDVLGSEMPLYQMRKGELLEDSVASAVLMVELGARARRFDLDAAYTTGLLHAIGKVVINQYFLKHGLEIYGANSVEEMDLFWERKLLGFDHAEAGAQVLEKWNFPTEISAPVRAQYTPLQAAEHRVSACQLNIACTLAGKLRTVDDTSLVGSVDAEVLQGAGLDADALAEAISDARSGLEEMGSLLA